MKEIQIKIEEIIIKATLDDTPTAEAIFKALPLSGKVNTWGDEIYFTVPLKIDLELNAKQEVEIGDLGYWEYGPAFCIFFGPTPVSKDKKPAAYSPVNVFGKVSGDTKMLKKVKEGMRIIVEPD